VSLLPRVLIADDHKVVVDGLVRLLRENYEIVGTINDGSLVPDAVSRLRPDVVILDISMPNMSGLEVLHQLKQRGIDTKTVVLTMHADPSLAVQVLKAGASAFVLKESGSEELLTAVETVLHDGTYLASQVTKDVVGIMAGAPDPSRVQLTVRQLEILRLLVQGLRAKEIASVLKMSTRGVEAIKYKTMQRLNVHSTAELVRYAVEHQLVTF
jgi:DNA-binding NarL/FixJ family response regulator